MSRNGEPVAKRQREGGVTRKAGEKYSCPEGRLLQSPKGFELKTGCHCKGGSPEIRGGLRGKVRVKAKREKLVIIPGVS